MRIVSDTSPISYLVLIGEADILPKLYEEIWIPEAVWSELEDAEGPEPLRVWTRQPPAWLTVKEAPESTGIEAGLADLDAGECEAILLAEETEASLIILDERAGRVVAKKRGLALTGTIGVLGAAALAGFVDAANVVKKLRQTSFRASPDLYRWLLDRQP